jgi:hypothetical protein
MVQFTLLKGCMASEARLYGCACTSGVWRIRRMCMVRPAVQITKWRMHARKHGGNCHVTWC